MKLNTTNNTDAVNRFAASDADDDDASSDTTAKTKIKTKRDAIVSKMINGYGLLSGSSSSMLLLRDLSLDIKKMLIATNTKFDPNITYPSILMLEMIADCM